MRMHAAPQPLPPRPFPVLLPSLPLLSPTQPNDSPVHPTRHRGSAIAKRSLQEQLEVLHLAYVQTLNHLGDFAAKFRGAGGLLVLLADARRFSLGVDDLFYHGPLQLAVPLDSRFNDDDFLQCELLLPDLQRPTVLSVMAKARRDFLQRMRGEQNHKGAGDGGKAKGDDGGLSSPRSPQSSTSNHWMGSVGDGGQRGLQFPEQRGDL